MYIVIKWPERESDHKSVIKYGDNKCSHFTVSEAITIKAYTKKFPKVEMTATEKSISVTRHQKITHAHWIVDNPSLYSRGRCRVARQLPFAVSRSGSLFTRGLVNIVCVLINTASIRRFPPTILSNVAFSAAIKITHNSPCIGDGEPIWVRASNSLMA